MKYSNESMSIAFLYDLYQRDLIDFNPGYQREFVWNNDFKADLILSLLKGYPIGNIIFFKDNQTGKQQVVDGQQRLRTIFDFIIGTKGRFVRFKKDGKHSKTYQKMLWDDLNKNKLNTPINKYKTLEHFEELKKQKLDFKHLPQFYKDKILMDCKVAVLQIHEVNQAVVADYFRNLQNQDRLRAGEILASYPNSRLDEFLRPFSDRMKIISKEHLKFPDRRKEIVKIFVNIIGLEEGKLALGCSDKNVRMFFDENIEQLQLKDKTVTRIRSFLMFLENIEESNIKVKVTSWKRFFKLLFILFLICDYNFRPNLVGHLQKLVDMNERLGLHASGGLITDERKKELNDYYKNDQNWNYDLDYRLFDITRNARSREKVKFVFDSLIVYFKSLFKKEQ